LSAQKLRIRLLAEARQDLREARDWYEQQRKGLGREFVAILVETLDTIVERPESFPQVHNDARRARMRKFPFGVFFRLPGDAIRVTAILNLRRDPATLRRRA
jgi:plasmid stabilization system protein ParE